KDNETSTLFLDMATCFDDVDRKMNDVFNHLQKLSVPSTWSEPKFLNWKQLNVANVDHRHLLSNVFTMNKVVTMHQACQLAVDYSNVINDIKLPIIKDSDMSITVKRFVAAYVLEYLNSLPSMATGYLILALANYIVPSFNFDEKQIKTAPLFDNFINNICSINLIQNDDKLNELQQILLQYDTVWKMENLYERIEKRLEILHNRKDTNTLQLKAFRWKNYHSLKDMQPKANIQRQTIYDELTKDKQILGMQDSSYQTVADKVAALEQTVVQRLRWATGANCLLQDLLSKFEKKQKQRANEIE
ncbi:unnamed protein product, partial [Didymodactylos carnosus]